MARTILKYLDALKEQHGWPIDCSLRFICLDKAAESVAKKRSAQDGDGIDDAWVDGEIRPSVPEWSGSPPTQETAE